MASYLYYDEDTGNALYTLNLNSSGFEPEGSKILLPEGFDDSDLSGIKVIDGEPVRTDLTSKVKSSIDYVNRMAGEARATRITAIPGQDMIYLLKRSEALSFLLDQNEDINLDDYPFIKADIGVTAPDAYSVAQVYLNLSDILVSQAADLEHVRLATIKALEAVETEPEIDTILNNFNSSIEPLLN